jgi:hypothetical protein
MFLSLVRHQAERKDSRDGNCYLGKQKDKNGPSQATELGQKQTGQAIDAMHFRELQG